MKILIKIILTVLILGATLFAKNVATITGLNGSASIQRDGTKIELSIGDKLQAKDKVITGLKSKVQIVFEDETVITVGKDSVFSINEYLFEENQTPIAKFGMLKGAMRTITGKIGKIAPDKFSVVTKTATIGIRGTNFSVVIQEDGSHNVYCTFGAISVEFNGERHIVKYGYYIAISKDAKAEIRELKPEDLKKMKEKNFGKSMPKKGLAGNESLLDNILEYDGEIVIKELEEFSRDYKIEPLYTPDSVIAGYSMQNAEYEGTYTIEHSTGQPNLIDGGKADLDVDFGNDSYELILFNSGGSPEISYDSLTKGANTNLFIIEAPTGGATGSPFGPASGRFYGATGNQVKGEYAYDDGSGGSNTAAGTFNVISTQTLH